MSTMPASAKCAKKARAEQTVGILAPDHLRARIAIWRRSPHPVVGVICTRCRFFSSSVQVGAVSVSLFGQRMVGICFPPPAMAA